MLEASVLDGESLSSGNVFVQAIHLSTGDLSSLAGLDRSVRGKETAGYDYATVSYPSTN